MQSDVPMLLAPLTQNDESLLSSVCSSRLTITSLVFLLSGTLLLVHFFSISVYLCLDDCILLLSRSYHLLSHTLGILCWWLRVSSFLNFVVYLPACFG